MSDAKKVVLVEDDRTGVDLETIKRAFLDNLFYIQGKSPETASLNDCYMALAYTIRDRLLNRWLNAQKTYRDQNVKTVGYLSAEFLMGPHLGNNLINLGLFEKVEKAMTEFGLPFKELLAQEEEPGLGNGGLGRLAACFLDSMATLDIPAVGYGIRYEFGIFDQIIENGWQVEITDRWLRKGNPWEIARIEDAVTVKFGGHTASGTGKDGKFEAEWIPQDMVMGVPYDTPILGYDTNTASTLRLWKSEAFESFDFHSFNEGDYYGAVNKKVLSENICKVLYPKDEQISGKELRLKQQYFFVSCSLQDAIRTHINRKNDIRIFHQKFAFQLNDTHPAIAIAELMRLLLDEWHLSWEESWDITTQTFGYTNHTLLPEALEKWSVELLGRLLPRHLELIYEINHRLIEKIKKQFPKNAQKLSRMSLIDESGERYVRMAHLACVGSHSVNGVAALHSKLLTEGLLRDFYELWPKKFSNKTNGVTPRRWVVLNNPILTRLISDKIGTRWIHHLDDLRQLEKFAEDKPFRDEWRDCKRKVKNLLVAEIERRCNITVNPESLFDVQVKRIHEYKRQHLNVLHIITLYNRIRKEPTLKIVPRTFIFGGKAAPGYFMAKLMIKLINSVKDVINGDPEISKTLKLVFVPDFNVTNSQLIYPGADLSEQISTAGKEASGTGNMKFMMNGALTIGTLDGANVEIREEVGDENFFLFGMRAEEVQKLKETKYKPGEYYFTDRELRECMDLISSGHFSHGDKELFKPMVDALMNYDPFMLMADYRHYITCQQRVSDAFLDQDHWARMSIINVARSGKFSSDRTIREYCQEIWNIAPVEVVVPPYNPNAAGISRFSVD
ncbi:MAG TPA: glycogen/starch/alpha-glucan phosphorylase [Cyclobacteriaceae bacterium]|nr:glycogen/starch/alpha-glucan phosphorylase [Cyclobacteriaceae bacterium]